jgi:hypothetical protein
MKKPSCPGQDGFFIPRGCQVVAGQYYYISSYSTGVILAGINFIVLI